MFNGCSNLENVVLGSNENPVTSLWSRTFEGCYNKNLTIKVYIADGTINLASEPFGASKATIEYYNSKTNEIENIRIGEKYSGNTEIDWKEIPNQDKVSSIVSGAFAGCTNLQIERIPDKVTVIGAYTFQNCTGIEKINLNNVTQIYDQAFTGCSSLKNVEAPKLKITQGMYRNV